MFPSSALISALVLASGSVAQAHPNKCQHTHLSGGKILWEEQCGGNSMALSLATAGVEPADLSEGRFNSCPPRCFDGNLWFFVKEFTEAEDGFGGVVAAQCVWDGTVLRDHESCRAADR